MIDNLITGANGFIGKRLMEKLSGHTVAITNKEILPFLSPQFKTCFFLSTYGNMAHHTNHHEMVLANVMKLIWLTWKSEGHIIFISSSSVTLPVQTSYSRTKRAAEEILLALPEVKSCIVRPYSVTGVGEQKEHLIPTLIRSCMEGEEMPFDPYPVHDFVDVEDVVDILITLAKQQITGLTEIGSGIPYTNQQVKELVEEVTGKKANTKSHSSIRPYDSPQWFCKTPNLSLKKSISVSITEMVEAYKREYV